MSELTNLSSQDKIDLIRDWADDYPSFDLSFIDSLEEQLDAQDLSDAQEDALNNIIVKWNIT